MRFKGVQLQLEIPKVPEGNLSIEDEPEKFQDLVFTVLSADPVARMNSEYGLKLRQFT